MIFFSTYANWLDLQKKEKDSIVQMPLLEFSLFNCLRQKLWLAERR